MSEEQVTRRGSLGDKAWSVMLAACGWGRGRDGFQGKPPNSHHLMATYWVLGTDLRMHGSSGVSLFFFFFLVLATPPSMWVLSSLTRDRTGAACSVRWKRRVLTTVLSLTVFFIQGNRFRAVRNVPKVTALEGRRSTQHLNPGGADPELQLQAERGGAPVWSQP